MRGCNICFSAAIWKIIPKLSHLPLLIWSTGSVMFAVAVLSKFLVFFLQFMTDGMLIREIMADPLLKKYRY